MQLWNDCGLSTEANLVFGHGNAEANLLFIGEAPGKKEDELGMPFMGAAGKLLTTLLDSINMTREDVYITNIVKYRPPENRDPTSEEKKQCAPWLQQEIDCINPAILVPLGRHALQYFVPKAVIGEVHGTAIPLQKNRWLFPLYHPAAAMYNGSLRQTLFSDAKALQDFMQSHTIAVTA